MWAIYAAWNLQKTEEQFMKAEMGSIEHLGLGLALLMEHHIETHGTIDGLQDEIASLHPDESGLDIMLIDNRYIVRLANQKDRIGKVWFEDKIEEIFRGHRKIVVADKGHHHAGRRAIDITVGVRDSSGNVVLALHLARWLDHLSGALGNLLISHGLFAVAMLLVVGAAVNLLTYFIVLRPLRAMNEELNQSGWLSSHPELKGGNEIERVQAALKDAIGQVNRHTSDLQERLKHSERLAVIGQMGAVMAHEIRNPLHIVRGTAETMLRRFPECTEFAVDIKEEVDRVAWLIDELLHSTRQAEPSLEEVDVPTTLENVRNRVQKLSIFPENGSDCYPIEIDSEEICVEADPVMLEQALTNLVVNAVEASPNGSAVQMRAHGDAEGDIIFEIIDSGTGIAEEDITRATEPFFTRKARGTGLGLAVVEKIADLHGGSFALQRRKSGGTRAIFRVPKLARGVRDEQNSRS
jgi:signal transduction histidine kinase